MGLELNRLAHQNFVGFSMEKTAEEIFTLYKTALPFIDTFRRELRTCSGKFKDAMEESALKAAETAAREGLQPSCHPPVSLDGA